MKINLAAKRRRLVLEILKSNGGIDRPLGFMDIEETMHTLLHPVSAIDLRGYLRYLADEGKVALTNRDQLPGYRASKMHSAERPDDIMFVKLLPKGLDEVE